MAAKRNDDERDERGFAAMDAERQREIASQGGRAAHQRGTAHEFTPEEARHAGRKGGESVSRNREHMAAIGRKGGTTVSRDREHMAAIGRRGGAAISQNREHMAAIGREGGQARNGAREGGAASGLADRREDLPAEERS
jgi:general stress protein YciG